MTRLSRQQHDLSTMMPLVRHQVCEEMRNIYGQVQPRHSRRWDSAALIDTEFKQLKDSVTASLERRHQLPARHRVSADTLRRTDAMSSPQHLDPHAVGIVNVAGDHPDYSPGRARDRHWAQFFLLVFEEDH